MPSGRTHDAVTLMLAAPVFAVAWTAAPNMVVCVAQTAAFVFGGLMFGPDLDVISNQYSRWGLFRPLWLPYRWVFKHRSRWSHGLIFGTLFRVVYCMGVLTLVAFLVFGATALVWGGEIRGLSTFTEVWHPAGEGLRWVFGRNILAVVFLGMWIGAASHTFTDMAASYIKTGRVMDFL